MSAGTIAERPWAPAASPAAREGEHRVPTPPGLERDEAWESGMRGDDAFGGARAFAGGARTLVWRAVGSTLSLREGDAELHLQFVAPLLRGVAVFESAGGGLAVCAVTQLATVHCLRLAARGGGEASVLPVWSASGGSLDARAWKDSVHLTASCVGRGAFPMAATWLSSAHVAIGLSTGRVLCVPLEEGQPLELGEPGLLQRLWTGLVAGGAPANPVLALAAAPAPAAGDTLLVTVCADARVRCWSLSQCALLWSASAAELCGWDARELTSSSSTVLRALDDEGLVALHAAHAGDADPVLTLLRVTPEGAALVQTCSAGGLPPQAALVDVSVSADQQQGLRSLWRAPERAALLTHALELRGARVEGEEQTLRDDGVARDCLDDEFCFWEDSAGDGDLVAEAEAFFVRRLLLPGRFAPEHVAAAVHASGGRPAAAGGGDVAEAAVDAVRAQLGGEASLDDLRGCWLALVDHAVQAWRASDRPLGLGDGSLLVRGQSTARLAALELPAYRQHPLFHCAGLLAQYIGEDRLAALGALALAEQPQVPALDWLCARVLELLEDFCTADGHVAAQLAANAMETTPQFLKPLVVNVGDALAAGAEEPADLFQAARDVALLIALLRVAPPAALDPKLAYTLLPTTVAVMRAASLARWLAAQVAHAPLAAGGGLASVGRLARASFVAALPVDPGPHPQELEPGEPLLAAFYARGYPNLWAAAPDGLPAIASFLRRHGQYRHLEAVCALVLTDPTPLTIAHQLTPWLKTHVGAPVRTCFTQLLGECKLALGLPAQAQALLLQSMASAEDLASAIELFVQSEEDPELILPFAYAALSDNEAGDELRTALWAHVLHAALELKRYDEAHLAVLHHPDGLRLFVSALVERGALMELCSVPGVEDEALEAALDWLCARSGAFEAVFAFYTLRGNHRAAARAMLLAADAGVGDEAEALAAAVTSLALCSDGGEFLLDAGGEVVTASALRRRLALAQARAALGGRKLAVEDSVALLAQRGDVELAASVALAHGLELAPLVRGLRGDALQQLLRELGAERPELYLEAASALLHADPRYVLPPWLVHGCVGPARRFAGAGAKGDAAALVRLYVRHGLLDRAARLAATVIADMNAAPSDAADLGWLPLATLDQLIDLCDQRLSSSASGGQQAELGSAATALKRALKEYSRQVPLRDQRRALA